MSTFWNRESRCLAVVLRPCLGEKAYIFILRTGFGEPAESGMRIYIEIERNLLTVFYRSRLIWSWQSLE
jgi:hypothetical protein